MIKNLVCICFVLLFVLYACTDGNEIKEQEERRDHSALPISKWTFDEILAIDEQKYETFSKDAEFIDIAIQYKKSRDYYYYSEEIDYKNISSTLDSIQVKMDKYAKEHQCVNLITYIDKYASTSLELGSRCYGGEKLDVCWKRAWDYYDKTYKEDVFKRIRDVNAVVRDIHIYLREGVSEASIVYKNILTYNYSYEQITSYLGGFVNYFKSLGIGIQTESEAHTINRALYDGFYRYYFIARWKEIGGLKDNPNECEICQHDPCICYDTCRKCLHYNIECVCCPSCGDYPCVCVNTNYITPAYPGGMIRNEFVITQWYNQNVGGIVDTYWRNYMAETQGTRLHGYRLLGNLSLNKVWDVRALEQGIYPVPVEAEDLAFVHMRGGLVPPNEYDIYCFAKAVEERKTKRAEQGITDHSSSSYVMYFITPQEVYALFSSGELGDFFEYVPDENAIKELGVQIGGGMRGKTVIYDFVKYTYYCDPWDEKLFPAAMLMQFLKCDIQILKLKKGKNGDPDEFVKGWYSSSIKNEEDVRK